MQTFDFAGLTELLTTFLTTYVGAFVGLLQGVLSLFGLNTGV